MLILVPGLAVPANIIRANKFEKHILSVLVTFYHLSISLITTVITVPHNYL